MSISPRMNTIEMLYDKHCGDIHYLMNQYDLSDEDFDFIMELKEFKNAG